MKPNRLFSILCGLFVVTMSLFTHGCASASVGAPPATLRAIIISTMQGSTTSATPSVANGTSVQLYATGMYTDNSTRDLTTVASWLSTSDAKMGSEGLVTAVAQGTATVTATFGSASGSTIVTVTPAILHSIAINAANGSIAKGTSGQFTATGTYSDTSTANITSQVTWNSASPTIATISAERSGHGRRHGHIEHHRYHERGDVERFFVDGYCCGSAVDRHQCGEWLDRQGHERAVHGYGNLQ